MDSPACGRRVDVCRRLSGCGSPARPRLLSTQASGDHLRRVRLGRSGSVGISRGTIGSLACLGNWALLDNSARVVGLSRGESRPPRATQSALPALASEAGACGPGTLRARGRVLAAAWTACGSSSSRARSKQRRLTSSDGAKVLPGEWPTNLRGRRPNVSRPALGADDLARLIVLAGRASARGSRAAAGRPRSWSLAPSADAAAGLWIRRLSARGRPRR
jgi:hypothetical protein